MTVPPKQRPVRPRPWEQGSADAASFGRWLRRDWVHIIAILAIGFSAMLARRSTLLENLNVVALGATTTFKVGVAGSAPFFYQWFHNGSAVPPPAG